MISWLFVCALELRTRFLIWWYFSTWPYLLDMFCEDDDMELADTVPTVIALTGLRGVGKTEAANYLVEKYGFMRIHPLAAGKAATEAWLRYLGAGNDQAWRMVHGDLKDVRCDLLPGGVAPRFFMEKFGRFMGDTLGSEWTLGLEINRVWRANRRKSLVVESLVYEADVINAVGGRIIRIERPGAKVIEGVETDAAQALIEVDATIVNDGTLDDLHRALDAIFL